MARKLRIQFPGAIYHIMSRGDRREDIFVDDTDRQSFLQTLAETCSKTAWQVHAVCLMPNHFHLVVETPQPNLVAGMKWFLGTYTARFNRRHNLSGHVFAGRYKSLLVGGEGGYLRTVCDYVHLNPVRAKLLSPEASLLDYPWSSFGWFVGSPTQRPNWLRVDRLFGEHGIPQDSPAGRREFEQKMQQRRNQELDEEFRSLREGWFLGDEQFRQELLSQVENSAGERHYGEEHQESAERKADTIIDQELRAELWTEVELRQRRKGDPAKLRIAKRLRAETTVTLQWIAARLHMGTRGHVSHLLYWKKREGLGTGKKSAVKQATKKVVKPTSTASASSRKASIKAPIRADSDASASKEKGSIPLTDPFDTSFD